MGNKKKKADLQKKLDKLKVDQEKKRIEQQNLREQASNPYNFSPNMEKSVRYNQQPQNGYQFNNPGQPQRYPNTNPNVFDNNNRVNNGYKPNYDNRNHNANYNPNETRDNFIQGRNSVDGLQRQSHYDQGGNQYIQNSRFMNNPYIQNRMNELNNNQN